MEVFTQWMRGLDLENGVAWTRRLVLAWFALAGVCLAMASQAQSIVKDINTLKVDDDGSEPSGVDHLQPDVYHLKISTDRKVVTHHIVKK